MRFSTYLGAIVVGGAIGLLQSGCTQSPTTPPASPTPVPAASPEATATATPAGMESATPSPSATPQPTVAPSAGAPAPKQAPVVEATPRPPRTFTLAAGRSIPIWTEHTISTKTHKTGDTFSASLAQPIVDGDWTIAKKGANVTGVVVNSDPGGKVKGVASIAIALKSIQLADGRTLAIATRSHTAEAHHTKKKDAKKIGIGAAAGALIGGIAGGGKGAAIGAGVGGGAGTAVVLSTRGDPATVPGEAELSFSLRSSVTVTQQK